MKIVLFANTDWYLYNFRLGLAEFLRERGNEVVLVSPDGSFAKRLQEKGFRWIPFPLERRGMNPVTEIKTILRLRKLYQREKPDLVHHFTVKCVLYGSLAAHSMGIQRIVNSVEGLGYVFTEEEGRRKWLQGIVKFFYRITLGGTWIIFHNQDDQQFFIENRLADPRRMEIIRGCGVDLKEFSAKPFPGGPPLVVLPARLLWDKGIREFVDAARHLKSEGVTARFALIGTPDSDNPTGVPESQLENWQEGGLIEWWGWVDNMAEVYEQAAIVCLPSFYREGLPKSLIEAAACGRPIVTTDMAGCREAVPDGKNGYLVPAHDVEALAKALKTLIQDADLREKMGASSRMVAEEEFSMELVNSQTLQVYEISKNEHFHAGVQDRSSEAHRP